MKQKKNLNSKISVLTYKHPRILIIISMVILNLLILLLAAFIAVLIDPGFTNIFDAFTNGSIKWMLTPNAILELENPNTLILASIVLVTGLVLFSGTIIALTTNILKDYFEKKSANKGKINLNNHILILNWNNKVPEIVLEMSRLDYPLTVCILAEKAKAFMEEKISNKLLINNVKQGNLTLIIKDGNPLLLKNLTNLSVKNARSIIVMSNNINIDSQNINSINHNDLFSKPTDMNIIKNLLSLSNINFNSPPHITSEVVSEVTKEKIITLKEKGQILKNSTLDIICFNKKISQILAQAVVEKNIENVYLNLLSFEDSEIYLLKNEFNEDAVIKNYKNCIPLNSSSSGTYVLSESSKISSDESCQYALTDDYSLKISKNINKLDANDFKLIIIGESSKNIYLEESFKNYSDIYGYKIDYKMFSYSQIDSVIKIIKTSESPVKILLLSEDTPNDGDLDSTTINALLYLRKFINANIKVVIELLDPSNKRLISSLGVENTVISNRIISLLVTRYAIYPETQEFYDSLIDVGKGYKNVNYKIIVKNVKDAIESHDDSIVFNNQKDFVAFIKKHSSSTASPVGIIKGSKMHILGNKNIMHKPFNISKNDKIVLLIKE